MENLTDLERKLITVLQHNNKKGRSVSLNELEMRLGHSSENLQKMIDDLISRYWIREEDGEWIVLRRLF